VALEGDDVASIGLTEDVQERFQHIEGVELPLIDDEHEIESICMSFHIKNGLFDVLAPVGGYVVETNPILSERPDDIFIAPYTDGWLFKMHIDDPDELEMLMDSQEYAQYMD
jgi:glycine cleavage system H protein